MFDDNIFNQVKVVDINSIDDSNAEVHSYSNNSFDMSGTEVTINGWQENKGTNNDVTVKYSFVKKNLFGDDVKGDTTLNKRYPENGTWYTAKIRVDREVPGVYLKTENISEVTGASGAGNVYQL